MRETLLIAHLHAYEVEHRVLHRNFHALAAAGVRALVERGENSGDHVNAAPRITDLRTGRRRRAVFPAGRAHRAAHRLGNRFIRLEIGVFTGSEAFNRGVNDLRVDLVDFLPREALTIECARPEIFDDDIAMLDQLAEDVLSFRSLRVERDAPLIAIEHREVERIDVRNVAELAAGDVTATGQFDLDDVGAEPRKDLGARRACLDVRHVENLDAVEGFLSRCSVGMDAVSTHITALPMGCPTCGSLCPALELLEASSTFGRGYLA